MSSNKRSRMSSSSSRDQRMNRREALKNRPAALSHNQTILNKLPLEIWGGIFIYLTLIPIGQVNGQELDPEESWDPTSLNSLALTCSSFYQQISASRFKSITLQPPTNDLFEEHHPGFNFESPSECLERSQFFKDNHQAISPKVHRLTINFPSLADSNSAPVKNQFEHILPSLNAVRVLNIANFSDAVQIPTGLKQGTERGHRVILSRFNLIFKQTFTTLKVLTLPIELTPSIHKVIEHHPQVKDSLRLEKIRIMMDRFESVQGRGTKSSLSSLGRYGLPDSNDSESLEVWNVYRIILGYPEMASEVDYEATGQEGKGVLEFDFGDTAVECTGMELMHMFVVKVKLAVTMSGGPFVCCTSGFTARAHLLNQHHVNLGRGFRHTTKRQLLDYVRCLDMGHIESYDYGRDSDAESDEEYGFGLY